ncbi:unnamed protein product [Moneuplotes crassus]|uniref:Uncharacterized protein n=1 Tax=Euplotes crassus TaxID=5936 RepID=A0AAD2DB88_EUPCR|nr:unnamed protein product [Moneuplotes crassus]
MFLYTFDADKPREETEHRGVHHNSVITRDDSSIGINIFTKNSKSSFMNDHSSDQNTPSMGNSHYVSHQGNQRNLMLMKEKSGASQERIGPLQHEFEEFVPSDNISQKSIPYPGNSLTTKNGYVTRNVMIGNQPAQSVSSYSSARGLNPLSALYNNQKSSLKNTTMTGNSNLIGGTMNSPSQGTFYYPKTLVKIALNHGHSSSQEISTPSQCKYCMDTSLKIDQLSVSLLKMKKSKEKLNIELLEKEGKIVIYEEKIHQLLTTIRTLEKKQRKQAKALMEMETKEVMDLAGKLSDDYTYLNYDESDPSLKKTDKRLSNKLRESQSLKPSVERKRSGNSKTKIMVIKPRIDKTVRVSSNLSRPSFGNNLNSSIKSNKVKMILERHRKLKKRSNADVFNPGETMDINRTKIKALSNQERRNKSRSDVSPNLTCGSFLKNTSQIITDNSQDQRSIGSIQSNSLEEEGQMSNANIRFHENPVMEESSTEDYQDTYKNSEIITNSEMTPLNDGKHFSYKRQSDPDMQNNFRMNAPRQVDISKLRGMADLTPMSDGLIEVQNLEKNAPLRSSTNRCMQELQLKKSKKIFKKGKYIKKEKSKVTAKGKRNLFNLKTSPKQYMTLEDPRMKARSNKSVEASNRLICNNTLSIKGSLDRAVADSDLNTYYNTIGAESSHGRNSAMTSHSNTQCYLKNSDGIVHNFQQVTDKIIKKQRKILSKPKRTTSNKENQIRSKVAYRTRK